MTKKLIVQAAMAALLAVPLSTARADLVVTTIQINQAQGFGNVQTIFTVQRNGPGALGNSQQETGCYSFGDLKGTYQASDNNPAGPTVNLGNWCSDGTTPNDVASGSPKNALPSLSDAGITNVSEIGLLLNTNQISDQGLTLNNMVLSFYTPGGDVLFSATLNQGAGGWCTIAALCSGIHTLALSDKGQGSSGTIFLLNAAQQAALAAAITASGVPFANIQVGASAFFGCVGATQTADCKEANDGAESLSLARVNAQTITPEPTTTVLAATGLFGLFGFARRRRNK